ncbi:MAG: DUF4062 domain-containing protein, partial [Lentisphaeria bacterium]|nr:DUF4062 domain-containing protein [Lentisphaeria bacterium]
MTCVGDNQGDTAAAMGAALRVYAPRVFVSATSRDLGSYRRLVCDELLRGECFPVVQDFFGADPRRLSDFLRDTIRKCDAVICLIGPRFGEAPEPGPNGSRSYTQMEYDAACEQGKDVYVFLPSDTCVLDEHPPEDAEKQRLQQEHIAAVQRRDQRICRVFSGPQDLRTEILRLLPELTRARQPKYWVQSPPPYPYFAGREEELRQLTAAATGGGPCVVVVMGVAGQGKTTLAWEWYSRHCPDVFAGAFWCPAEENGYPFDMFVDLALAYLMQGRYDKRSVPRIQTRVKMLLQHLQDRPCLIVLDGLEKWLTAWSHEAAARGPAEDLDGRRGVDDGLDLFLGQLYAVSGGSHVVLTSRVLPAALESAPHAVIPVLDELARAKLQGLEDAAAVSLLKELGVRASDEEILDAARRFDNHPLSLTILGKLAERRYGGSLERFLGESRAVSQDDRLRGLLDDIEQALPNRHDSTHLLELLAHFIETPSCDSFAGFLRWLVLSTDAAELVTRPTLHLDGNALREGLAILDDWSLITWDRRDDSLHLHALIRERFREARTRSERIHAALAEWYLGRPIAEDVQVLAGMRARTLAVEHALRAHAAELCDRAILMPVALCSSLPEWLALWGHQTTGIDLLTRTIAISSEPRRSMHRISRGAMWQDLGKLVEARDDLSEAIRWLGGRPWRRVKYRRDLAGAMMNRGNAFAKSGNPAQAVDDFNGAWRALAWPLGLRRRDAAMGGDILTNRGGARRDLGELSLAERDATRALALYELCRPSSGTADHSLSECIATTL